MGKIDQAVIDALDVDNTEVVDVVITCRSHCAGLAKTLRRMGVDITKTLSEIDVIAAKISKQDVDALDHMEGIEAVELDEEVSINNSGG